MTRYFILSIFFLVVFNFNSSTSWAGSKHTEKVSVNDNKETGMATTTSQVPPAKSIPALPATQPIEKSHGQTPSMEEVAHIHHFHKGRVKKIKRHHKKCWVLSKVLLILCHVALLVIAYLHIIH